MRAGRGEQRVRTAPRRTGLAAASAGALLVLAALAGCSDEAPAKPLLIDDAPLGTAFVAVEFGPVLSGQQPRREITLRNPNSVAVRLKGFFGTLGDQNAFAVALGSREIAPGGTTSISVEYRPAGHGNSRLRTRLEIEDGIQAIEFEFRGGAFAACHAPTVSSPAFAPTVPVGTRVRSSLRIRSPYTEPWPISLAEVQVVDGADVFDLGVPRSTTLLVPGSDSGSKEVELPIEFTPTRDGPASGRLQLPGPPGCAPIQVPLQAVGAALGVECRSDSGESARDRCRLDFGRVELGTSSTASIYLVSRAVDEIAVQVGAIDLSGGPAGLFAFVSDAGWVRVPGRGTLPLPIRFEPREPGRATARFAFSTTEVLGSTGYVELQGAATGPRVSVNRGLLEFRSLMPGEHSTMPLDLANIGYGEDGALRFVQRDAQGTAWVDSPPELVGPNAADFSLEWSADSYPAAGIAPDSAVTVQVRFSPTGKSPVERVASLILHTNDLIEPRIEIPIHGRVIPEPACDIAFEPRSVNFGVVAPNGMGLAELTIRNVAQSGRGECTVNWAGQVQYLGSTFSFRLEGSQPGTCRLVAGETASLTIGFHPDEAGIYAGMVWFSVGDDGSAVNVPMFGISERAHLAATPSPIEFGAVNRSCGRIATTTITNRSSIPAVVARVVVQSQTANAFTVINSPHGIIDAKTPLDVSVLFKPTSVGEFSGTLELRALADPTPFTVPIHGTGADAIAVTENFQQEDPPAKDFLFVVDDSPAMADKQTRLAAAFGDFFDQLEASDFDYHLAVTTTSIGHPGDPGGRILPLSGTAPRVISRSTANRRAAFLQNANVGTSGSATPQLLLPIWLALTSPLIDGDNAGFLRYGARLTVVVISASADSDVSSVGLYATWLRSLVPASAMSVSLIGIIPTQPTQPPASSGCTYASATAGTDTRLAGVVTIVGGVVADVCSANWPTALNDAAHWPFPRKTWFTLSGTPVVNADNPITVRIDAIEVPEHDEGGAAHWTLMYANTIRFEPNAAPPYRSLVEVTYFPTCQ